jgi:flavin-dependent dehydrogenase
MSIAYRLLIAADGPHSFVARSLGMPRLATVHARQYAVPLNMASEEAEIWLSPDYPGGYAWLFPKGKGANLGLGVDRGSGANPKALLDALHARLIGAGRVGKRILSRTGGEIPVGGLRSRLVLGKVIFVGDAAGLTHPITGAGIANAVISGELAGRAAADLLLHRKDHALNDFEEELRDRFGVSHRRAVSRRAGRSSDGAVGGDDLQRRAWVSFPEYYEEPIFES